LGGQDYSETLDLMLEDFGQDFKDVITGNERLD
jgi:hypothetical protein